MTTPPILRMPRRCVFMPRPLTRAACCAIRRTRCTCTVLSIMPPKAKKPKLIAGQKTLSFAQGSEPSTALPLESAVSSLPTVPRGWDVLGTPSSRRRAVTSWRAFAAAKWHNKHPCIVVEDDGVYCLYCKAGTGLERLFCFRVNAFCCSYINYQLFTLNFRGPSVFISSSSLIGIRNTKGKLSVLWLTQRAHCWFWGRPKGHIRGPKGHSALRYRPRRTLVLDETLLYI